jgi:hypothetical protein
MVVTSYGVLPCSYIFNFEFFLEDSEKLLNWIQEGGVLGIEKHIGFHHTSSFQHSATMVKGHIVHKKDDVLVSQIFILPYTQQSLIDEVLKNRGVDSSFHHLV